MRKRLLIVTDEMELGGTQRQILEIARNLDPTNYEVHLLYFRNASAWVDDLREAGIAVECIAKRHRLDPLFLWRLCRYLQRNDFDLIHAFSFSGELWSWFANAMAGDARLISSIRGVYLWYSPAHWWLKRWVTRRSAAVVANSHAGAEYAALQMGIRRSGIDVIYNATRPAPAGAEVQASAGSEQIVFVGRLDPVKNLACLLRAMRLCRESHPRLELDIVGDGEERERLEQLTVKLMLSERVHFHGQQNDPGRFIRKARCLILPSRCEGLSNAIMEAMSAGRPVIASNVGGNAELVAYGVNGLLFPSDDESSLAQAIERLLDDPAYCDELGAAAQRSMQSFQDMRRMTGQLATVYERSLVARTAWLMER